MPCACSQKRKADDEDPDALGSSFSFPPWIVCMNSLMLYQDGVELPDELKLSKKAAREVRRIREWAMETNAAKQSAWEAGQPAEQAVLSPPQTVHVDALRPTGVTPAPTRMPQACSPWDPATLEMVARAKSGPRVGL